MLTEYKNDFHHYFIDAQCRYQGEAKWWDNGQIREHFFYVDGKRHGECKVWDEDGTLRRHEFWDNDELYRNLLENPVYDDQEKFMITLETGGKWLC